MVAKVQSNQVRFRIHRQTDFDGGADLNPVFDVLPRTTGDFTDNLAFTQSEIVDTSRQARPNILTGITVEGTLNSEMQVADAAFKEVVQGTLQNSLSVPVDFTGATISFDNATSKILDSGNGFTGLVAGDFFAVYGASVADNNQVYLITDKVSDGELSVSPAPTDEVAGASITVRSQTVRSSDNRLGYTVQKVIATGDGDAIDTFENCQFSSLNSSVSPGGLVSLDYSLLGLERTAGTTGLPGETENALIPALVSGSVVGVPQFFINNEAKSGCGAMVRQFDIAVDNGSEGLNVVGSAGACDIRHSDISVTGTLNTLLLNTVLAVTQDKILSIDETQFPLAVAYKDAADNYMIIDMPNVQYTAISQPNTGKDDTYEQQGTYSANGAGTAGYTVGFTFISAP